MIDPTVYICSAGHSGSTLLNLLLGGHPRAFAVGEITQLPKNIALDSVCSCQAHLSACPFWAPALDAYGRELDIDLWNRPYELNLGFIKAGREIDRSHQTRSRMAQRKIVFGLEVARLLRR